MLGQPHVPAAQHNHQVQMWCSGSKSLWGHGRPGYLTWDSCEGWSQEAGMKGPVGILLSKQLRDGANRQIGRAACNGCSKHCGCCLIMVPSPKTVKVQAEMGEGWQVQQQGPWHAGANTEPGWAATKQQVVLPGNQHANAGDFPGYQNKLKPRLKRRWILSSFQCLWLMVKHLIMMSVWAVN